MTDNQEQKYTYYTKMAWAIYALIVLAVAVILVLFVARDNEERLFYGFMAVAGSYAFRPTDRFFSKLIFKYTGVAKPTENE